MREELIAKRQAKGLTQMQMARRCNVSVQLIIGIEADDWITHPKIVAAMAQEYGFGIDTFNQLVCKKRREKTLPKPGRNKKWNGWMAYNGARKMDAPDDP